MSTYTPDVWVILKIDHTEEIYKILAGWHGGFSKGDSWKLNSGITKIIEHDTFYDVRGYSGSNYILPKDAERMNITTASIFRTLEENFTKAGGTCEIVFIQECLDKFPR